MYYTGLKTASLALGLALGIQAHLLPTSQQPTRRDETFSRFSHRSPLSDPEVYTRQSGAKCGPSGGYATCPTGWCCGPNGTCGQSGDFCTAPACLFQWGPACDANQSPAGKNISANARPTLGKIPYGVVIRSCTVPGKVALTFDDGPYIYTAQLLDTLKAAGAKATFFVVAINGGKGEIDLTQSGYPGVIQRMVKEGHQVASHTWSHQDMTTLTQQQRIDQVVKNEIALSNILGLFPTYMRPPYANTDAATLADLKALGYHVVNYDVDTNDWKGDYTAAKNNFLAPLQAGNPKSNSFLTLSHDIHQNTVTTLVPYMLEQLKKLGYTTATVGECLGDPPANWYRDALTGDAVGDSANVVIKQSGNSTSSSSLILPTKTAAETAFGASSSATTSAKSSTTSASSGNFATPSLALLLASMFAVMWR